MQSRIRELTEFPEEIIFSFSPESTHERLLESSTRIKDGYYAESMQYVDLLEAYLYAQDEIIPEIRSKGLENISPSEWTDYVLNIHRRIGQHLLSHQGDLSGQYSATPVWRWHNGSLVYFSISDFLCSNSTPTKRQLDKFCVDLASTSGYSAADVLAFMTLIFKLKNKEDTLAVFMIELFYRYHSGNLSFAQKAIVEKIAKPGSRPEDVPQLMSNYGVALQNAIRTLDKEDPQAISSFLASQFYGLTHIHPFPNCNGRTATCLINILLRALNQPAIVLRDPNDRSENSNYAQAMSVIDHDLKPFEEHIFHRLYAKQSAIPNIEDTMTRNLIKERIETSLAYQKIWEIDPDFDADSFQSEKIKHFERYIAPEKMLAAMPFILEHEGSMELISTLKTIELFQYIRETLSIEIYPVYITQKQDIETTRVIAKVSTISLMSESQHLNKFQQVALRETLEQLSQVTSGWILYKKGTVALYQSRNQAEVVIIAEKLRKTAACDVQITALAEDKSTHVIKVTQIILEKLSACAMDEKTSAELFMV